MRVIPESPAKQPTFSKNNMSKRFGILKGKFLGKDPRTPYPPPTQRHIKIPGAFEIPTRRFLQVFTFLLAKKLRWRTSWQKCKQIWRRPLFILKQTWVPLKIIFFGFFLFLSQHFRIRYSASRISISTLNSEQLKRFTDDLVDRIGKNDILKTFT